MAVESVAGCWVFGDDHELVILRASDENFIVSGIICFECEMDGVFEASPTGVLELGMLWDRYVLDTDVINLSPNSFHHEQIGCWDDLEVG